MLITNYSKDITNEIIRIHNGRFPFPNLNNHSFIQKRVVIDKGRLIGCGLIKLTSEFILILDESAPLRSRVTAILELKSDLCSSLVQQGIHDTHIFVDNDATALLAERFQFERCSPALTLQF